MAVLYNLRSVYMLLVRLRQRAFARRTLSFIFLSLCTESRVILFVLEEIVPFGLFFFCLFARAIAFFCSTSFACASSTGWPLTILGLVLFFGGRPTLFPYVPFPYGISTRYEGYRPLLRRAADVRRRFGRAFLSSVFFGLV